MQQARSLKLDICKHLIALASRRTGNTNNKPPTTCVYKYTSTSFDLTISPILRLNLE